MTAQPTQDRDDPYRENRQLIEEICQGCCVPGKYCTLKEILIRSPKDLRTMVQIKCIEKLKYERSAALGTDIGWQRASDIWILEGYAEAFGRLYRRGMKVDTIYASVVKSVETAKQLSPPPVSHNPSSDGAQPKTPSLPTSPSNSGAASAAPSDTTRAAG